MYAQHASPSKCGTVVVVGAPLNLTATFTPTHRPCQPHTNHHITRDVMPYAKGAESAYQKKIRGSNSQLRDHICKEMNPVNLHRCK